MVLLLYDWGKVNVRKEVWIANELTKESLGRSDRRRGT
jgi:hypothetical protein